MNILIVDDLLSVVEGIVKGIDWGQLGITGIYKAFNTYEAKVLINNLQIDILLTDIEMPGESGLELVEWIRQEQMDMECIFMSSHANFEYAQRAVEVNSYKYVLLPCPYEEIAGVVSGAVGSLRQRREQEKLYQYGKILADDMWFGHMMFYNCLDREKCRGALQRLEEVSGLAADSSGYLCILDILKYEDRLQRCDEQLQDFMFHNVISELLGSGGQKILLCRISRRQYVFLVCGSGSQTSDISQFRRQIRLAEDAVRNTMQIPVMISFETISDLTELPEAYERLGQKAEAVEACREESQEAVGNGDVIGQVVSYVREHISQDIKRSDLANVVHLNIDYLSRIFKREKGITLNDYIILEKLNVAENLLKTTRLPISLIATKVGYSNFSYFSKLYKKVKGKTPAEERTDS